MKSKALVLSQPTLLALKGIQAAIDATPFKHAVLYDCTLEVEVTSHAHEDPLGPHDPDTNKYLGTYSKLTEVAHRFSFHGNIRFEGSENSNEIEGSISVSRPNPEDADDDDGGVSWRLGGNGGTIKLLGKLYEFGLNQFYFTAPLSVTIHSCKDV